VLLSPRRVLTVFVILRRFRRLVLALLGGRFDPHDFLSLAFIDLTPERHVTGSRYAIPGGGGGDRDLENAARVSSFNTNHNRRPRWVPRSPFLRRSAPRSLRRHPRRRAYPPRRPDFLPPPLPRPHRSSRLTNGKVRPRRIYFVAGGVFVRRCSRSCNILAWLCADVREDGVAAAVRNPRKKRAPCTTRVCEFLLRPMRAILGSPNRDRRRQYECPIELKVSIKERT